MKKFTSALLCLVLILSAISLVSCAGAVPDLGEEVNDINGLSPLEAYERTMDYLYDSYPLDKVESENSVPSYKHPVQYKNVFTQDIMFLGITVSSSEIRVDRISKSRDFYHALADSDEGIENVDQFWCLGGIKEYYLDANRDMEEYDNETPTDYRRLKITGSSALAMAKRAMTYGEKSQCYVTADGRFCVQIVNGPNYAHLEYDDSSREVVTIYFDDQYRITEINFDAVSEGLVSDHIVDNFIFKYDENVDTIPAR